MKQLLQVLIFLLIFFGIVILIKDVEPQPYNRNEFECLDSTYKQNDSIRNGKNKFN